MVYSNFVKLLLENDGIIKPIYIDNKDCNGTGLCNASILFSEGKLRMILRNVEYTLYHCEGEQQYQSCYEGPLSYYHRDDDLNLRTENFYCELNPETLEVEKYTKIDMSRLNVKPIWHFIGLEDARLVFWNNKYYACGVRRDTTENGQGRIELSELEIKYIAPDDDNNQTKDNIIVTEISRNRIEVQDTKSYCEKNWMPIKNSPFHFVKWTNPTEIVDVDLTTNLSKTIVLHDNYVKLPLDLRGGSQLIPWIDNTFISIVHECKFVPKNYNGHKDADYYHKFVIWNKDFTIKYISESFNFMTGRTEFCIGMEEVNNNIIIVFGFQDNTSYAIKIPKNNLNNLIWKTLKNVYQN